MKYTSKLESHWKILKETSLLHTMRDLRITCQEVELPDKTVVSDFYQVSMPETATIMAITKANEVLCLEQYKHGPRRVCLTLPGGFIERDEAAMDAAKRELLEETGFIGTRWLRLGSFVLSGNQGVSKSHLFLALNIRKLKKAKSGDLEEMELNTIPIADLYDAIIRGDMPIISHVTAALLSFQFLKYEFEGDTMVTQLQEI